MRLSSFEVHGFKNLVAPIKLDALEPINVLHGANNVGKSNLMQHGSGGPTVERRLLRDAPLERVLREMPASGTAG